MDGTIVSTVSGLSGHKIRLTLVQGYTASGATGTTTLTWRVYYQTTTGTAYSTASRNTKFTIKGGVVNETITANWSLGGWIYENTEKLLASGTISVPRTLDNSAEFNVSCNITSTHILTGTDSWSSSKGPGTTNSYAINAVTLATGVTAPTSITVTRSKVPYDSAQSVTINWSGQSNGINNNISKYYVQYNKNNSGWNSLREVTSSSTNVTLGTSANISVSEGDSISFRVGAYGSTLKDTVYSSITAIVKVNRVPVLSSMTYSREVIKAQSNDSITISFNASDGDGDSLTYQYSHNGDSWINCNQSNTFTFSTTQSLVYKFRVSDGLNSSNEISKTFTRNTPPSNVTHSIIYNLPDSNNQNLTLSLKSSTLNYTKGYGTNTVKWIFYTTNKQVTSTSATPSNISFNSLDRGEKIKYSITITDALGESYTTGEQDTGKYTPSNPSISNVILRGESDNILNFYKNLTYTVTVNNGDYYSTIKEYKTTLFKTGSTTALKTNSLTSNTGSFIADYSGSGIYYAETTVTDAFGLTHTFTSNSLTKYYKISDIFKFTNLIQNPSTYKPIDAPDDSLYLKATASSMDEVILGSALNENYNWGYKITANHNGKQYTYSSGKILTFNELKEKLGIDSSTSGIDINLKNEENIILLKNNETILFSEDLNKLSTVTYSIQIFNDYEDGSTLTSSTQSVDFTSAPSVITDKNISTWSLNGIPITPDSKIDYYLSYEDVLSFSVADLFSDKNENDTFTYTALATCNGISVGVLEISGSTVKWTNTNRETTLDGDLSFKVSITDSSNKTATIDIISFNNVNSFRLYQSKLPTLLVDIPGGTNYNATITISDVGHDSNINNYFNYYSEQSAGIAEFSYEIYVSNNSFSVAEQDPLISESININTNNGNKVEETIANEENTTLYVTILSSLKTASGVTYELTPIQKIWYGLAPTISPRKNQIAINMKAEEVDEQNWVLAVHPATNKEIIVFYDTNGNIATINLKDRNINGFIISGGTWDDASTSS